MSSSSSKAEIALQICFGLFSIIGIVVAIAGIHHRDSLASILLRNKRSGSSSSCMGQLWLNKTWLTQLVDHNLPSRVVTPSGTTDVDIELGLVLPPSHINQTLRTQENNGQVQDRTRLGISCSPASSLAMPRAAYDRSRSPSISRPAAN